MVRMCNLMTLACVTALVAGSAASASDKAVAARATVKAEVATVVAPSNAKQAVGGTMNASIFAGPSACTCTWDNGDYDQRDGQVSHQGGAVPHGSKAADDFTLCDGFVYDLNTISANLLTTTFAGLVKPIAEIWSDCSGCPDKVLYTFVNAAVLDPDPAFPPAGVAFDGRPLRVVKATWEIPGAPIGPGHPQNTQQTAVANRNVVLKGGIYWLSVYGQSDGLGPSMQMYDVTYWGTTALPIKGKPAYKINGDDGNPYNVFTYPNVCGPNGWHSVTDDCCIGCTDLNFKICATACKVLVDNGVGRVQVGGAANGSTSQFAPASWSAAETRSADDFLIPPCQAYKICYVEACVLTNCPTFEGVFELYRNNCNKPDYALHGQALNNTQYVATKIIPLGALYNSVLDGKTVYGYKLEFHDLNIILGADNKGGQFWISVGVRYTFSINERAFFCYNSYCDSRCPIHWNEGRVLTASTLDTEAAALGCVSAAPIVGCNGWAKTGNDFSFLIAADGQTTPGPINSTPTCAADYNVDGTINSQDIFDYLNAWFTGCP